jgi:hypothetical protein
MTISHATITGMRCIGLALYLLPTGAKLAEVGRILFFAGSLAALMQGAHSCSIH